jgi:hypothetical protein
LLLAVLVGRDPRVDVDRFVPLLEATLEQVRPDSVLADAVYDSESNNRYAREQWGIRSFIAASLDRPTIKLPSGRYRRRMKQRLRKIYGSYGQRWQVETAFSVFKQRLGSTVNCHSYWSQCRKLWLLAITYNIMLLYNPKFFYKASQ